MGQGQVFSLMTSLHKTFTLAMSPSSAFLAATNAAWKEKFRPINFISIKSKRGKKGNRNFQKGTEGTVPHRANQWNPRTMLWWSRRSKKEEEKEEEKRREVGLVWGLFQFLHLFTHNQLQREGQIAPVLPGSSFVTVPVEEKEREERKRKKKKKKSDGKERWETIQGLLFQPTLRTSKRGSVSFTTTRSAWLATTASSTVSSKKLLFRKSVPICGSGRKKGWKERDKGTRSFFFFFIFFFLFICVSRETTRTSITWRTGIRRESRCQFLN